MAVGAAVGVAGCAYVCQRGGYSAGCGGVCGKGCTARHIAGIHDGSGWSVASGSHIVEEGYDVEAYFGVLRCDNILYNSFRLSV